MTNLALVLGISLAISFLCSVLEAVLLSINHSFVALLIGRGERAGRILEKLKRHIDEPIAAILTLNTIAHTVGATLSGALALEVFGEAWIGIFSAVLTFVILVFSEIIPKTIGATFWKQLARPTAYLLRAMVVSMKPVLVPLNLLSRLITPKHGTKVTVSRAELAGTVQNVGLKTTRMESLSGEQLVFNNSDLLSSRIRNYKRMRERRILFKVGVVYGTPKDVVARIPELVEGVVNTREETRFDRCHFKEFGDSALIFETVYYMLVPDYNAFMDTQQAINLALYEAFEDEGIEFAFPTQTIHVEAITSS